MESQTDYAETIPSTFPGDEDDDDQHSIQQMHTTGFWVTGANRKLRGKLRFRIRSFDVGVSGEHAFLSIEGTMLDDIGERTLEAAAAEDARQLLERKGITRATLRQVPDFSVTKFSRETEEEASVSVQRRDAWQSSRAASEI